MTAKSGATALQMKEEIKNTLVGSNDLLHETNETYKEGYDAVRFDQFFSYPHQC